MASADFEHQRLRSKPAKRQQFRLIRLLPSEEKDIYCELRAFCLLKPPVYSALSYRWTQDPPCVPITVNKKRFLVRPNLYAYLAGRKDRGVFDWIFIDAICVNQDDASERNSQVSLMGDIYRSAAFVTVWLGVPALTTHRRVDQDSVTLTSSDELQDLGRDCDLDRVLSDDFGDGKVDLSAAAWRKLAVLICKRDYWNRVWIIQELVLAQYIVIRLGPLQLKEHAIRKLISRVGDSISPRESKADRVRRGWGDTESLYRNYQTMSEIVSNRQRSPPKRPETRSLAHNFQKFAWQACSVPHDRIFGLMGISETSINPNYDMPLAELYTRVLVEASQGTSESEKQDLSRPNNFASFVINLTIAFGWMTYNEPKTLEPAAALLIDRATRCFDVVLAKLYESETSNKLLTEARVEKQRRSFALSDNSKILALPGEPDDSRSVSQWHDLVGFVQWEMHKIDVFPSSSPILVSATRRATELPQFRQTTTALQTGYKSPGSTSDAAVLKYTSWDIQSGYAQYSDRRSGDTGLNDFGSTPPQPTSTCLLNPTDAQFMDRRFVDPRTRDFRTSLVDPRTRDPRSSFLDPRSVDPRSRVPQSRDLQSRDLQSRDTQSVKDNRYGDTRYGDTRYGDTRYGDTRYGDNRYADTRHLLGLGSMAAMLRKSRDAIESPRSPEPDDSDKHSGANPSHDSPGLRAPRNSHDGWMKEDDDADFVGSPSLPWQQVGLPIPITPTRDHSSRDRLDSMRRLTDRRGSQRAGMLPTRTTAPRTLAGRSDGTRRPVPGPAMSGDRPRTQVVQSHPLSFRAPPRIDLAPPIIPLPPGWFEATAPNGVSYYFDLNHTVSWQRPTMPAIPAAALSGGNKSEDAGSLVSLLTYPVPQRPRGIGTTKGTGANYSAQTVGSGDED